MIARMFLLALVVAGFFGVCMWGLKNEERGLAAKWGLRALAALLFGVIVVLSISFIEGISK